MWCVYPSLILYLKKSHYQYTSLQDNWSVYERCLYMEFFWSVFSWIWIQYWYIIHISPYSVRIRENTEQKNYENRHFSRKWYDMYISITSIRSTSGYCGYIVASLFTSIPPSQLSWYILYCTDNDHVHCAQDETVTNHSHNGS